MSDLELRISDPVEALIVEQALVMARELKRTCDAAKDGQVLAQAERVAMAQGRELTRKSLEAVLNQQAEEVEKKGAPAERVLAQEVGNIVGVNREKYSPPRAK